MSGFFKTQPPSRDEHTEWVRLGYTGDYKRYLEATKGRSQMVVHYSGKAEYANCRACDCLADDFLCDYPVGEGVTCDANLCRTHAKEVAEDTHYCPAHYEKFRAFQKKGGVKKVLENVVAFSDRFRGVGK